MIVLGGIFILGCHSFACILQMIANISQMGLDLHHRIFLWEEGRKHLSLAQNVRELWHLTSGQ